MAKRNIIQIDEEKCNGCGLCVPSCAEGAIQIVDGKARLVSETFCDGLGACLGECPQGAISIEERDAAEFDPAAVEVHLAKERPGLQPPGAQGAGSHAHFGHGRGHGAHPHGGLPHACPGQAARVLQPKPIPTPGPGPDSPGTPSQLTNWPVQLMLLPQRAPYLDGADLLIAADCAPFAYADFHRDFMPGKTVTIGCPKLDDGEHYLDKLTRIFRDNDIRSIQVVHMEVPCCFGLVHLVRLALEGSGKTLPLTLTKISIRGEQMDSVRVN